MKLLCILGAGASIDSGLNTYRGPTGLYAHTDKPEQILNAKTAPAEIWTFLKPLYQKIAEHQPGPTYKLLQELIEQAEESLVVTQNIDNYAYNCGNVVHLHGTHQTMRCVKCNQIHATNLENPKCNCESWCRPNIVLFGEDLDNADFCQIHAFIKRKPTYTLVIGTSLQFQYLVDFIHKAKKLGSKIIHINPDHQYYKNVGVREMWIQKPSAQGLQDVIAYI